MSRERVGLFELSASNGPKTVDVVAVHGLQGDAFKTWEHENGSLWLRDFLPKELPSAHVMTFGYDSTVAFSKSVAEIEDKALDLLNRLVAERAVSKNAASKATPIIFICHSMGGILVKKAIVLAHERCSIPEFEDIANHTTAIAFMGVPHKGSTSAWWGNLAANILNSVSIGTSTNTRLIADLRKNSSNLVNVATQFVHRSQGVRIYTFYETKRLGPVVIVDKVSAQIGVPNERLFAVDANHRDICRFASITSQEYKAVGGQIAQMIRSLEPGKLTLSKEQSDCLRDLYLFDPGAAKDRVPPRVQGTCSWLLTHHSYMEWLASDGPCMLWVTGAPGSGKTVLSTFLIDEFQNTASPHRILCFFFSDDKYALQKSAVALLRGILYQLLLQNQDLVKHALVHWNVTAGKTFEELSVLWKICTACFDDPGLGDVICVLDALDECEAQDRGQLLTWLIQFIESHQPGSTNIKFLLTSRPEIGIADILEGPAIRIRLEMHEDKDWLNTDIEYFISHEINALPVLRKWSLQRKEQLRCRLIQNADRTFLWVSLVLQRLPFESRMSEMGLAMILSEIPDRLEDIYRDILMTIPPEYRQESKTMLAILVMAQNPLSQSELQECWAIRFHHDSIHHMMGNIEPDIQRTVGILCGQFVRWERSDNKRGMRKFSEATIEQCRLVHQSAKDFLLSKFEQKPAVPMEENSWFHLDVAEAARTMATRCVWYANLSDFRASTLAPRHLKDDISKSIGIARPDKIRRALDECCDQHPFLHYVLHHWAYHFREVERLNSRHVLEIQYIADLVIQMYRNNVSIRAHWFMKMLRITDTSLKRKRCNVPPLAFCAYNGHNTIAPHLLKLSPRINASIPQLQFSALHMAVLGKHLLMVDWLLQEGANIEAHDAWNRTPLHLAARRNNKDILSYLLKHGAIVSAEDQFGITPIQGARERGLMDHVELLASYETEAEKNDRMTKESCNAPNAQAIHHYESLHRASGLRSQHDVELSDSSEDDDTDGHWGNSADEVLYDHTGRSQVYGKPYTDSGSSSERLSLSHAGSASSLASRAQRSSSNIRKATSVSSLASYTQGSPFVVHKAASAGSLASNAPSPYIIRESGSSSSLAINAQENRVDIPEPRHDNRRSSLVQSSFPPERNNVWPTKRGRFPVVSETRQGDKTSLPLILTAESGPTLPSEPIVRPARMGFESGIDHRESNNATLEMDDATPQSLKAAENPPMVGDTEPETPEIPGKPPLAVKLKTKKQSTGPLKSHISNAKRRALLLLHKGIRGSKRASPPGDAT